MNDTYIFEKYEFQKYDEYINPYFNKELDKQLRDKIKNMEGINNG